MYTGIPSALPFMSHSAMSMALIAQEYTPSAGKNEPLNMCCQSRSVENGSWPTTSSERCSTALAIDGPQNLIPDSPSP